MAKSTKLYRGQALWRSPLLRVTEERYSYGKVGEQKIVVQKQRKGRRMNIMGLWEQNKRWEYGIIATTFKSNR